MIKILLVEDIAETREWLTNLLQETFKETEISNAPSLERAQSLISSQKFNLALVDISLPDGVGIDLVPLIRSNSQDTFVVIMTIHDDDRYIFEALKNGAHGYLLKDDSETRIRESLSGTMKGNPPLTSSIARKILRHFGEGTSLEYNKSAPTVAPQEVPKDGSDASRLTNREREILIMIAQGLQTKEISSRLNIKNPTTASYIREIYVKLSIKSRAEATLKAVKLGLVEGN